MGRARSAAGPIDGMGPGAASCAAEESCGELLSPRSGRPQVDQVIQELRGKLAAVPGITVFLRNDPPIRIGGIQSKALYQFTLQGASTSELFSSSQDFLGKMRELPGLEDVTSDLQIKNPQINVVIDRDKSSTLGVTANQVENALYSAYGFRQVSTIFAPNNQYRVILELQPEYQRAVDAHRGKIFPPEAKSGTGTTFTIYIPARFSPEEVG